MYNHNDPRHRYNPPPPPPNPPLPPPPLPPQAPPRPVEADVSAAERKRRRLEAWRKRQQQQQQQGDQPERAVTYSPPKDAPPPPPAPAKTKITLSLGLKGKKSKAQKAKPATADNANAFFEDQDAMHESLEVDERKKKRPLDSSELFPSLTESSNKRSKTGSRWDSTPAPAANTTSGGSSRSEKDALDQFMEKLEAGASGQVTATAPSLPNSSTQSIYSTGSLTINVDGSMTQARVPTQTHTGVITAEELTAQYSPHEWLSDAPTDDENEEEGRRALIEALKSEPRPSLDSDDESPSKTTIMIPSKPAQLAAEVKSEKSRKENRLKELERQAEEARHMAEQAAAPTLGRLYNDVEGGVIEEAERNLQAAQAAPDALTVLAELNKKKELKAVDHSKIEYMPFQKNLYRVPRSMAQLTHDEVINRRAKLKVRVRGQGAPAPVSTFEECGLSAKILSILTAQEILTPYPIQAQCIPCIMAGRDVIGIAKTGSGKTLAYLLPMLRHILVQPPLEQNESGPIGLVLAPARELAFQIHSVCKRFAKQLGLKSTAVYGGAGVAEQIADLKRGTHIVVATPGRLIDILTMQSGKILSLQRVTYVVMDEADRMYDMGFAPQISAVLAAVRPDKQTVLFSATFPKAIESLARKSLSYPVEVVVGGRSVVSDNVTQYAELIDENEKFLRLLQLLGEQVEGTKKVLVFVDTQVRADNIFEQLLRNGYPSLSLHGGKEQEDRDTTIADFKRKDGPNILVATGVAGRGLDVPACSCVINYSAPNHLEAYVHQAGRTGRAGKKGVCFTLVNPTDEAKYSPIIVRAMSEAGQSENIQPALKQLSDDFKAKVEKGEAKYAGSGFKGKGYTYDASEMTEAQKMAQLEKRQALIEAGLLDPDEDDPLLVEQTVAMQKNEDTPSDQKKAKEPEPSLEIPENLTPELLALPGMKEALLRKAGIVPAESSGSAETEAADPSQGRPVQMGDNHWLQEFEINDYPREARWKVTQKETTSRLQDEFRTAVTLKGSYFGQGRVPGEGERRLYLHLEATSDLNLKKCVLEIQRLLNEETLRVSAKATSSTASHKYNVLV